MSIHINPKNKGKFNATKKRTGKTTEELTHSKNPLTRKRAIFAQNAKKWKHGYGGNLFPDGGDFDDYPTMYGSLPNQIEITNTVPKIPKFTKFWNKLFRSDEGYDRFVDRYYRNHYPEQYGQNDNSNIEVNYDTEADLDKAWDLYDENYDGTRKSHFNPDGDYVIADNPTFFDRLGTAINNMANHGDFYWYNNYKDSPQYRVQNARYQDVVGKNQNWGDADSNGKLIDYYGLDLDYPIIYGEQQWLPADSLVEDSKNSFDPGSFVLQPEHGALADDENYIVFMDPLGDRSEADGSSFAPALVHEQGHTHLPKKPLYNYINTDTSNSEDENFINYYLTNDRRYLTTKDLQEGIQDGMDLINSSESDVRGDQVMNYFNIDSMQKLENLKGTDFRKMFEKYLQDKQMDNNMRDLYELLGDGDTIESRENWDNYLNWYINNKYKYNKKANGGNLINNNINNNNMYNKFETGGTKKPRYNQGAQYDYFDTDHLSLNDEPEYYAGEIPEVVIKPQEYYTAPNDATYVQRPLIDNQKNYYPGVRLGLDRPTVTYTDVQPFDSITRNLFEPYFTAYKDRWKYPLLDVEDVEEIRRKAAEKQYYNAIKDAFRMKAYGGNIYAPGGEMQMSPEEAAMMQQQGAEGMPPEMAGGMPADAEQGMPVQQEGGMPPEMMGGQEQMSQEEMEEQQYEEERRQAFEEAREEAREEGKKTFEFEGRIYVTETGQLVNNEKACGGRLHGYGGNMFAYGGLEDYIDYDLGPGDPPTKKSSLNNVKVDNTIKGSVEKQAEQIAQLAGLKAYFQGKAREAAVNKIMNAYNSTFKAPANQPNYDQHMGEEYVVSRDKYMKGDDTNYLREPQYDPAGLNNGTFMGGGAGGRIPWKDSPYYNDEWKILPLEEQRKRTFNEAYRDARNRGLKTFEFDGGLYTTDYNPNLENWKQLGDSRVETLNNGVYNIYNPIGVVPVKRNEGTHKAGVRHYRAEGGPLNYDIEEPYPYDEGYTPEQAYQQQQFDDLEAQRREAYNQQIKNKIKERLLREYGITEDELNASRRREARKKKKAKK